MRQQHHPHQALRAARSAAQQIRGGQPGLSRVRVRSCGMTAAFAAPRAVCSGRIAREEACTACYEKLYHDTLKKKLKDTDHSPETQRRNPEPQPTCDRGLVATATSPSEEPSWRHPCNTISISISISIIIIITQSPHKLSKSPTTTPQSHLANSSTAS